MNSERNIIVKPGQEISIKPDESSQLTASCTIKNGTPVLRVTSTYKTNDPINGENTYSSTVSLPEGTIFGTNSPEVTIRIGEPWENSD